jgi:hypothetical protein
MVCLFGFAQAQVVKRCNESAKSISPREID